MTHIAVQEHVEGKTVDWLEQVSGRQYDARPASAAAAAPAQPTPAQKLFGDINPKLAELTDKVLFGDVWARPGLSPRDRSLVTVSALIAMNRPDQLRSHLALARENGVTEDELIEAITHLAFYSGWPNAVTATTVAREVFQKSERIMTNEVVVVEQRRKCIAANCWTAAAALGVAPWLLSACTLLASIPHDHDGSAVSQRLPTERRRLGRSRSFPSGWASSGTRAAARKR